jgi:hypothetical protein
MINKRIILFWILGSFLIFFGATIAGQAKLGELGVNPGAYYFAIFLSFLLILVLQEEI